MRYSKCLLQAPIKCDSLMTKIAYDVNEQANNLNYWEQCYDQITSGHFFGSTTELAFEGLQLFHEFTSQQLHQRCKMPPNCVWLGITSNRDSKSRVNGLAVENNHMICRQGDGTFELITPKNHHCYGMVVQKEKLNETAALQGIEINDLYFAENERLWIPESVMENLRFLLNRLLREAAVLPGAKLQEDLVMMFLLEILQNHRQCKAITSSYRHRKQVVDRVRHHLDRNQDRAVSVTELCHSVGTCRRTLQYSFESIIGISPIKYMRAMRLNGARRSLLSITKDISVAEAAANWGFLHLSQFAKDYRELFGELPSDTLIQAQKATIRGSFN